ncbi:MAG: ThuA domain-containing protein [Anaerolineae bacterium]|nr:ThuA domain-containing protein [Anaerolineae bacterium]
MSNTPRVTVWNEYRHEKTHEEVANVYPNGIHNAIAEYLKQQGLSVQTATLDEPEHGLTEEVLDNTDVLTWWGHMAHGDVSDAIVQRVKDRVLDGKLGLVVLHSGHFSKIFKSLMGTTCNLKWHEIAEKERIWVVEKSHPIAEGLPDYFELEHEEMYGEHFGIPAPDELVFLGWFQSGYVFRSGCCFHRGNGRIFYFQPGHETYPNFYNENVRKVIYNAIKWAAPKFQAPPLYGHFPGSLEA